MTPSAIIPNASKPHGHSLSAKFFESFPNTRATPEYPGKFIYALVHEIRNPLTNINLAIEILKQTVRDEDQETYLNIIKRNSERIKDLVAGLLISQKTQETKTEKHSVHYLLDEVLMMNEDRFMLRNIAVRKNYSTRNFKIESDRSMVKIALTNIIINAAEAMPAENGLLEITTKLLRDTYFIVIKDNGTGISKENLNRLFKPYFTSKPGGMGLGLSSTLSILRSNNIGVNVRSEPGKGTRFILSYKKGSL